MNKDLLACALDARRAALFAQREQFNGIDFVEVGENQLSLCVHFFGPVPEVSAGQVTIAGGSRITGIEVVAIRIERAHNAHLDDCLHLALNKAGDFSTYTVSIHDAGLDRRYAAASFSFKVDCPRQLDCLPAAACAGTEPPPPSLDYLAKDYASFRQLILDRLALTMPGWQERHAPDLGIALVEVLAYAADHLSYYQDAVATEAYLDTARQRISVRRHVRLVDYFMHEGLNARAWVSVATSADTPPLRADEVWFLTGFEGIESADGGLVDPAALVDVPAAMYEVFEPVGQDQLRFYAAHSEMHFYTWGDADCCLARGATTATLLNPDCALQLKVGEVLIFEEVAGPRTGNRADADPAHRHAVRLTRVAPAEDPLFGCVQLLDIAWDAADALPFALCLSARLASPDCRRIARLSVARGNVVLVDHGRSVCDATPAVAGGNFAQGECACEGSIVNATPVPEALRFALQQAPLVFSDPAPLQGAASGAFRRDERAGRPALWLSEDGAAWEARPDLLASGPRERHFVAEMDDAGIAHLRFGDGRLGLQPLPGASLRVSYRIGGGPSGNVGRNAIAYMVLREQAWSGITVTPSNPIAASGGLLAETTAEARLRAPHAFRSRLQRAITPEDYAAIAQRHPGLQRAAARLRWTGSWYEMRVAADALGTGMPDAGLLRAVEDALAPYRRIGHDLDVVRAVYVPLDIELKVCIAAHAVADTVRGALLEVLGSGAQGLFHADRLSFGGSVHLSQLVAAAQAVEGVASVDIVRLQRLGHSANNEIENGVLPIAAMEIAQLDNDPNFPERGKLVITTGGGR